MGDVPTIEWHRLDVGKCVGVGTYKTVFQATLSGQGPVAVLTMRERMSVDAEASLLLSLGRHPRLARFYGTTVNEREEECIVSEFAAMGALDEVLETTGAHACDAVKLTVAMQVCEGMERVADMGLVHRDLAARNVLVFEMDKRSVADVDVKVGDFGLTRRSSDPLMGTDEDTSELPTRWMAPESLANKTWSQKSDVFAFGVLVWEILCDGAVPYDDIESDEEVAAAVCQGVRPRRPYLCSDAVFAMVQDCWRQNPDDRPTFGQLRHRLWDMVVQAMATSRRPSRARTSPPATPIRAIRPPQLTVVHDIIMWRNGFTVGETGRLRWYDNVDNLVFLNEVNRGLVPAELLAMSPLSTVRLHLVDKKRQSHQPAQFEALLAGIVWRQSGQILKKWVKVHMRLGATHLVCTKPPPADTSRGSHMWWDLLEWEAMPVPDPRGRPMIMLRHSESSRIQLFRAEAQAVMAWVEAINTAIRTSQGPSSHAAAAPPHNGRVAGHTHTHSVQSDHDGGRGPDASSGLGGQDGGGDAAGGEGDMEAGGGGRDGHGGGGGGVLENEDRYFAQTSSGGGDVAVDSQDEGQGPGAAEGTTQGNGDEAHSRPEELEGLEEPEAAAPTAPVHETVSCLGLQGDAQQEQRPHHEDVMPQLLQNHKDHHSTAPSTPPAPSPGPKPLPATQPWPPPPPQPPTSTPPQPQPLETPKGDGLANELVIHGAISQPPASSPPLPLPIPVQTPSQPRTRRSPSPSPAVSVPVLPRTNRGASSSSSSSLLSSPTSSSSSSSSSSLSISVHDD